MGKYTDDEWFDRIQSMRKQPYRSLREIPDNFLITILRIRGYEGDLCHKPCKYVPVRHRDGTVTLKYTSKY